MWIHVPPTSSVSAQDTGGSNLDSTLPWVAELARSVTWKTNSVSPASLRRVWRTVPSIRRLSGLICEPLTQSRGVERLISYAVASRASHTQSLGPKEERMTQESCQERSSELPPDLDTQLSFLKMSPESLDSTGTPYDPNYERWVTRLRKDSSQRQRRAHLTSGNGSSSWRSPTSNEPGISPERLGEFQWDHRNYDQETGRLAQVGLTQQVRVWPTPNSSTHGEGDTNWKERRERIKEQGINGNGFGLTLGMAATSWPTPQGDESGRSPEAWEQARQAKAESGVNLQKSLHVEAKNWPTPNTRDTRRGCNQKQLATEVDKHWMTPNTMDSLPPKSQEALDHEHDTARQGRSSPNNLRDQAAVQEGITNWPTPNQRDWKGAPGAGLTERGGHQSSLPRTTTNWPTPAGRDCKQFDGAGKKNPSRPRELYLSIPQDPATTRDGHTCSPSCRRLNPLFVEMIMGLCPGWTDDSVPLAMGSFRQWQHSLLQSLAAL
jgi:hypothetical protein